MSRESTKTIFDLSQFQRFTNQPLEGVILIKIADDYLIKRLLERGRQDDNEEVIINRLKIYREKTSPLIDLYAKQGILEEIEGNADIDVVFSCIEKALGG